MKIQAVKEKFAHMDTLLLSTEKELAELKTFSKKIKKLQQNVKILDEFYRSEEWTKGREILFKKNNVNEVYYSASEDPIWDLTNDFFKEKLKLIQQLAKDL